MNSWGTKGQGIERGFPYEEGSPPPFFWMFVWKVRVLAHSDARIISTVLTLTGVSCHILTHPLTARNLRICVDLRNDKTAVDKSNTVHSMATSTVRGPQHFFNISVTLLTFHRYRLHHGTISWLIHCPLVNDTRSPQWWIVRLYLVPWREVWVLTYDIIPSGPIRVETN